MLGWQQLIIPGVIIVGLLFFGPGLFKKLIKEYKDLKKEMNTDEKEAPQKKMLEHNI